MIYKITKLFPREEIYGLTSQMRRAAVSIPSNIVEGCARESQSEYVRFLEIAYGSLKELRYQYSIATGSQTGRSRKGFKRLDQVIEATLKAFSLNP